MVGKDIEKMVLDFFRSGKLAPKLNETNLVLILKKELPSIVTDYRPISLCNFGYKVILKLFANCLKKHLHRLVSPLQSAIVGGRLISDNVIVTQEVLHTMRKKKGKGSFMFLKLDMEKAYDRVSWGFLRQILSGVYLRLQNSLFSLTGAFVEKLSRPEDLDKVIQLLGGAISSFGKIL